jgi:hypothetical protein
MMRKYIAATLSIAVAIGPASALDVGVSGKAGGVGVSAGASVGSNGVSAGVGASVGGIGGVSGGASAGSGGASGSASVGAGGASGSSGGAAAGAGNRGGTSAGSRSDASRSAAGSGSAGTGGIGTPVIRPAKGVRGSIILPPILRPSGARRNKSSRGDVGYPLPPLLRAIPGTPSFVIRACRNAIVSAAAPLGAVRVRAASAGPVSRQRHGAVTAPIEVRIEYARQGGIQLRQAKVRCRLDAAGRVIAVM